MQSNQLNQSLLNLVGVKTALKPISSKFLGAFFVSLFTLGGLYFGLEGFFFNKESFIAQQKGFFLSALLLFAVLVSIPYLKNLTRIKLNSFHSLVFLIFLADLVFSSIALFAPKIFAQNNLELFLKIYPFPFLFCFLAIFYLCIDILQKTKLSQNNQDDLTDYFAVLNTKARLKTKAGIKNVNPQKLNVGDVIIVEIGEVIPADGKIINGSTSIDESPISGEKTVRFKAKDDWVTAGVINRDGRIEVEIIRPASEHFLFRLFNQLNQNVQKLCLRQKKQRLGLFILSFLIPLAFCLLLVVLGTFLFKDQLLTESGLPILKSFFGGCFFFLFGLTPAFFIPQLIAQNRWLSYLGLVKKGFLCDDFSSFDQWAKTKLFFFNKTGTLTKGRYLTSQVLIEPGVNQGLLLSIIFSTQKHSKHAIARGIRRHPWYGEINRIPTIGVKEHPGLGLTGYVELANKKPMKVCVGSARLQEQNNMKLTKAMLSKIEHLELMGETVILCGWQGKVRGLISLTDVLRPKAKDMLVAFYKEKVKTGMLTSDHEQMVVNLSYSKGLKPIYTRCLAKEKAQKIKKHQGWFQNIAVVGSPRTDDKVYQAAKSSMMIAHGIYHLRNRTSLSLMGTNVMQLFELYVQIRKKLNSPKYFILALGGVFTFLWLSFFVFLSLSATQV